jgi:hypothetical protein
LLFGHAGFDVTELLGDHAHGNAMHGQSRAVGVPEHVESNSRLDVCPLAGPNIGRSWCDLRVAPPSCRVKISSFRHHCPADEVTECGIAGANKPEAFDLRKAVYDFIWLLKLPGALA